jgi:hypothetical protein
LCYIENDDVINCTINFQEHMENLFSRNSIKNYNSHFIWRYIYTHTHYDILSIDFVILYFDVYIFIFIDFMFKVQMHALPFENICKP